MNFTTDNVDPNGTWLQGYMEATRREIEAVFGKPFYETDDTFDKVTTEWVIQFEDGTIATVYDWKRYEEGAPSMDERTTWNIGGRDQIAVDHVTHAVKSKVMA
jgi:hypothetical protein